MTGIGIGIGIGIGVGSSRGGGGAFTFSSGIGINTWQPTYYDPNRPYLNLAKHGGHGAATRGGVPYLDGRWVAIGPSPTFTFNADIALTMNSDGYVTNLNTASEARYYIATAGALHPASGSYIAKWSGSPTVTLSTSGVTVTSTTSNRIEFTWDGVELVLKLTAPGATPMSNLVVCLASDEAAIDAGTIFSTRYINAVKGVANRGPAWIRTISLSGINKTAGSGDTTTVRPESFISWTQAPPSICAKLAVAAGCDLYWCCPHEATSGYMTDAADAIWNVLDGSGRRVLVEWSNEVWNSGTYAVYAYALAQGAALGTTDSQKVYRFQAQQSMLLWSKFEAAGFVKDDTLFGVFAGWRSSSTPFDIGLIYDDPTFGKCKENASFAAIAFYVGMQPSTSAQTSYLLGVSPVSDLFNTYSGGAVPHLGAAYATALAEVESRVDQAEAHGLPLISYEGGQHNVGVGSEQSNTALRDLFITLSTMSQMGDLYDDIRDGWAASGAWGLTWYTLCSPYDIYGTWGLTDDLDDVTTTKYARAAAMDDYPWWDETPIVPGADRILDTLFASFNHAYGFERLSGARASSPLVRLRRSSDSAEADFTHASANEFLDMTAVLAWSGSDSVYVVKFYDQIGSLDLSQTTAAWQAPIVNAGTPTTYGASSRVGLLGNQLAPGSGAYYYNTASGVVLEANSGYVTFYKRVTSSEKTIILQEATQNGSGFHCQQLSTSGWHHQDLSSASPSPNDTADRVGSAADTTTGHRCAVGRRNSSNESDLWLNGTQHGTTRTGIGAAGPTFSRLLAGQGTHSMGSVFFAAALALSQRPSDGDIADLATHFSTYYPA